MAGKLAAPALSCTQRHKQVRHHQAASESTAEERHTQHTEASYYWHVTVSPIYNVSVTSTYEFCSSLQCMQCQGKYGIKLTHYYTIWQYVSDVMHYEYNSVNIITVTYM